MYRIMLVEDDSALANVLKKTIEAWGNEVIVVTDFMRVTEEFEACQPQMVLLDIMLPFYNGFHWCREIRRRSNVPIIFLSSASDNMNIVMAVNMGGDDFIPKPVDPMVLTAKLQATLRRAYELPGAENVLECHGALFYPEQGILDYKGQRIELTKNELRILKTLLQSRNKIVSREKLMNDLWQDDLYVEENTLTVNVARLRKKLEGAGLNDLIQTKPGSGYMIS